MVLAVGVACAFVLVLVLARCLRVGAVYLCLSLGGNAFTVVASLPVVRLVAVAGALDVAPRVLSAAPLRA